MAIQMQKLADGAKRSNNATKHHCSIKQRTNNVVRSKQTILTTASARLGVLIATKQTNRGATMIELAMLASA
jgi:hypothetical protein